MKTESMILPDIEASKSSLQYLLTPFFKALNGRSAPYCVCGNHERLPEYTSHDVDIWTGNLNLTERLLFEVAEQNGFIHYIRNKTANGSNNFFYKSVEPDFEIIRIDLMDECAWKSIIPIVSSKRIGESRIQFKEFFVSDPALQTAMHLLYPLLTKGALREKYKGKIYAFRDHEVFRKVVSEALGRSTAVDLFEKISSRDWGAIERNVSHYRRGSTLMAAASMDIKRLGRLMRFVFTNIKRLVSPSGLFIALIGLDGCGKTTILGSLKGFFENAFTSSKVGTFYWRPFILPRISELCSLKKKKEQNPETGNSGPQSIKRTPLNAMFYFIKFLYYLADFILGRIKYQAAWSRGGIVCFDRYYYDHLLYPQRFSFIVSRPFMTLCMRLVPKPDIVFFLDAPPEVLVQRKEEFPLEELRRQRADYKTLVSKLQSAHKIDTTTSLKETVDTIMATCLDYMAGRMRL